MRCKQAMSLCAIVVFSLFVPRPAPAASTKPVPIVLDTDIGTDIDDAFALALVLKSPELDLRAVTTVSGDTQARARLAAKMLWVDGRRNIPVAAGTPGKKLDIAQTRWADGFTSPSLLKISAVELLKREIDRGHGAIVIVAIGPLTNVAALLKQYPAEKGKIRRIVLMGGSIARGYYPGSGPSAEYNIAADAQASQVVFTSDVPITMAPLDVTARLQLDEAHRQKIFGQGTPLAEALHAVYQLWGQPTPTLHDPMAVSLMLDPALCTMKPLAIEVTDKGMTVPIAGKKTNAMAAVETDPARFIDFYTGRLTH
ncbi:MAG TPA: nucleoside hydrolase [Terracidiphilus sp.]|nr:nucleoside hydrolase [Terracidiphilus sp.]